MSAEARTILLVQDGSEIIRQSHADSTQYFENLVSSGYLESRNLRIKSALDSDVAHELAGASPEEYACIVFTSNALIRSDGPIPQTLTQRARELEAYVAAGGGLIFLHQSFADDIHEMVELASFGHVIWRARSNYMEPARAKVIDPDSAVLHFPNALSAGDFDERSNQIWRANFPLYYRTLALDPSGMLHAVLDAEDGSTLLAIGENVGRVAFTGIPCDWARASDLLENLIAYVIDGLPDIVVVDNRSREDDDVSVDLVLARIGGELPTARISIGPDGSTDGNASYLLSRSSLCLLVGPHTDPMASIALSQYVARGGSVAHIAARSGLGYQRLNLYLGNKSGWELAALVQSELALLDFSRWTSAALIFDIRDVWLAAEASESVLGAGGFISPHSREALRTRCRDWLRVGQSLLDPGTGVLVLWLLEHFGGEGLDAKERQWLAQVPAGLAPEMEILRRTLEGQPYWTWLVENISVTNLTSAGAIRLLDSIVCAHSSNADVEGQEESAAAVVRMVAHALATDGFNDRSGWISIDGTASVVTGLASLATEQFPAELLQGVLANGSGALIRESRVIRLGRSSGPLTAIRVHAALLRLELASPLGGHGAILKLAGGSQGLGGKDLTSATLREALLVTQASLAQIEEESTGISLQLQNLRVASVDDMRVAAAAGRILWSVILLLALSLVGYSCFTTVTAFIGQDVSSRLTAIATLAAAISLLGATWFLGERYHLRPTWLRIGRDKK